MSKKPLYHYTTGRRLAGIEADGAIIPATAGVEHPEIPAVWLSTTQSWEHTATKLIVENGLLRKSTLAEMVAADGCLVRLEIDPAAVKLIYPINLKKDLRIPKRTFAGLISAALLDGANPGDWRAVAASIPLDAVLCIEIARGTGPLLWEKRTDRRDSTLFPS